MDVPYVPRLVDNSAVGGVLTYTYGAIVIDSVYSERTLISLGSVLALLMLLNHHIKWRWIQACAAYSISAWRLEVRVREGTPVANSGLLLLTPR